MATHLIILSTSGRLNHSTNGYVLLLFFLPTFCVAIEFQISRVWTEGIMSVRGNLALVCSVVQCSTDVMV